MKTKINELYIKAEKGKSALPCEELRLLENQGALGDIFCAKDSKRQICILFESSIEKLDALKEKGVCAKRFTSNIVLSGAFFEKIKIGTSFKIGDALLTVTQIGKECFGFCGDESCPLTREAIFARVSAGGLIKKGDDVCYA